MKATLAAPRAVDPLQSRIESAIQLVRGRALDQTHGFWTIFHGILGLGPQVTMLDRTVGKPVKALDFVRLGGEMPGLRFDVQAQGVDVFTATDRDRFYAQGHQDQFVAEMAQWGVPLTLEFNIGGRTHTFADFVRFTKMRSSLKRNQELAWAILILSEYEGTDQTWTNQFGETVKFVDMIRYELDSPMDAEQAEKIGQLPLACGGTHRLYGLSWALHIHLQKGGQLTGVWKDLNEKLIEFKKQAKEQQNPDGSFSTLWFMGRNDNPDPGTRLNTTGHIMEWLALALTDEELSAPWVQQAVSYLSQLFFELQGQPVEGGSIYHAVHGLLIYYARVYGTEKLGENVPYVRLPPTCKPLKR